MDGFPPVLLLFSIFFISHAGLELNNNWFWNGWDSFVNLRLKGTHFKIMRKVFVKPVKKIYLHDFKSFYHIGRNDELGQWNSS